MNSIKTYVEGKSLKVFFIISYQGKRFQVYTGITSTVKFSGMIFPKSVPNARAKTAMLARLFASVEEYIYMNGELPAARMKDEIKAIISGRTASVEKNILYYIDEFIKTKATCDSERNSIDIVLPSSPLSEVNSFTMTPKTQGQTSPSSLVE